MTEGEHPRLVVELDDLGEPISGLVVLDDRPARFVGWSGLVAAIDAVRRALLERREGGS